MNPHTSTQEAITKQDPLALPPWPHFEEDEVEAAARVLRSGKVNQWGGHEVKAFENEFASFVGTRHAVAVANGTVALELALESLGVGPGHEVVVPPRTFVATASAVLRRGATPVFADVDQESGNLSAETLRPVLTARTKAVIPVHLGGWPVDMDPLMTLAAEHDLYVIEDCAQAHGATYHGLPVGTIGHVGCFSFCQDKIMTTGGEGGMVVTDDERLWNRIWSLKDHGKDHHTVFHKEHAPGFRWLHTGPGTNARMTEMQAAIGRVQLGKLPDWLAARRRNAGRLAEALSDTPALHIPMPATGIDHAYYRFHFHVDPVQLAEGWDRDRIVAALSAAGLPGHTGACSEIYLEDAFTADLRPPERLPVTRRLGETALMLPVHHRLGDQEIDALATGVQQVMEDATA